MKKRLMAAQKANLQKYLSHEFPVNEFDEVYKFTIDSVIDDKFRVLISKSKDPVPRLIQAEALANFEMWKEDGIVTDEKRNAYKKYGIRSNQIEETKVFIKFLDSPKALEITEFVRQESKNHYLPLLKREHTRKIERRERL